MPSRIDLKHARITERLIGLFFEVYRELGHGFLESVYEEAFAVALAQSGMRYFRQVPIAVWFRGRQVGQFKADAVVEDAVMVELKAAKQLTEAHQTQLINYLNATTSKWVCSSILDLIPSFCDESWRTTAKRTADRAELTDSAGSRFSIRGKVRQPPIGSAESVASAESVVRHLPAYS